jgi:hypothetical protein
MRRTKWISLGWLLLGVSGCTSVRGPGVEFSAPRVTGRVVAEATGQPLRGVRVGRELSAWKAPLGGLWKGAEELRLLQRETRTTAGGEFKLPAERVAFLLGWGEAGFDLRLRVRAVGYQPWQTNYPVKALAPAASPVEPWLDAGEIRLRVR